MGVKLGNGKWAIKEDKLLAYNDNSGRFFNKEFDFSRGSSATYVAKDGLIKTAGLQETNLVNNGDFSELGSELITNGDFSDGETGWTKGGATSATQEVVNSALVMYSGSASDANNSLSRTNTPQGYNGKIYKLELTVSDMLVSPTGFIRLDSVYDASNIISFGTGTSTIYFTAYRDFTHIRFFAGSAEDGYTIDNVSVKQVDPNDYWTLGTGWSIENGELVGDGSNTSFSSAQQNNATVVGKTYKAIVVVKAVNGAIELKGNGVYQRIDPLGIGTHTLTFVADATYFRFLAHAGATITIDSISIQEIQTDTPRIDFSDTVKGALLLEPSSTQLIQYSEQFSQWSKINNPTVVVSSELAPNGTIDAYDITDDTVSYKSIRSNNVSINGTYNGSIFIRKTLGVLSHYPGLEICSVGSYLIINTTNGSVNQTSNDYSSIKCEDFGNWWRVSATVTASGSSGILTIWPAISINGTSISPFAQGTNTFWGAMVEQKSFSTSYIPNYGVSGGVTRLADVCNNSGSAQDFNSEEGVLYAEISALVNDSSVREISLSDGTANNRIELRYGAASNRLQLVARSSGSVQASISNSDYNILLSNKVAIKYKANDFALWINGVEVGTDTSGNAPSVLSELAFDDGNGTSDFYGKVREVQVFTEALTDEQLQKLTTI